MSNLSDLRKHLPRRSIIPVINIRPSIPKTSKTPDLSFAVKASSRDVADSELAQESEFEELPDPKDVQGDLIYLFPKKAENFIFFRIANRRAFKKALESFTPSSSEDVAAFIVRIAAAKAEAGPGVKIPLIWNYNTQVAFSRMGLNALGVKEPSGDVRFDKYAMSDNKAFLGDQRDWDPAFRKSHPDPIKGSVNDDDGALHGVFTISGSEPESCTESSAAVKMLFGSSITVVDTMEGRGRPGKENGHEHFGFEDGVSQPALRDLTEKKPGQIAVDPGVIIMGYKGDPVVDNPTAEVHRPTWAKGGSMMAFRKLEQYVPEFNAYVTKQGPRWREFAPDGCPVLTDTEGADLFGARMLGRWKSGAPLALAPYRDDDEMAKDSDRNNNFDYHVHGVPSVSPRELSDHFCPFTAHTRKTAPRNLDPYIRQEFLESGMIVRAGLPYGIEVTDEEKKAGVSSDDADKKRGLLFVSYQSSLDQGFVRQTIAYAGNDYFPTTSLIPQRHGQDPIIGGPPPDNSASTPSQVKFVKDPAVLPKNGDTVNFLLSASNGDKIQVSGIAEVQSASAVDPPGVPQDFFVTSRGGEYFFVPPISALKTWAVMPKLDVMFVVDATASMQPYIDQARDKVESICDDILKLSDFDLRFGLIAFRDHAQTNKNSGKVMDYSFDSENKVIKSFGFVSDISVMKTNLAGLTASGGGDGPEAQADALNGALSAAWRDKAFMVTIMITDSPPHGINESGDYFIDGCPEQFDPVAIADRMADLGITLHVIACEPKLSVTYGKAHDFYVGITEKTGGKMTTLSKKTTLAPLIVGRVSETVDIQHHSIEQEEYIKTQARAKQSVASISKSLHDRLTASNVKLNTFVVESVYEASTVGDNNAKVWLNASKIAAKDKIKPVSGLRVKSEYRGTSEKAQSMELSKQLVSLSQSELIVKACLNRKPKKK